MHPAERWLWRWVARPALALAAGSIVIVVLAALASAPLLYSGWRELASLRQDRGSAENRLKALRRELAAMPTAARLENGIARLRREQTAGAARRQDPGDFIIAIDPGRDGKLSWRAPAPLREPEQTPRRWTAQISTDYPGLRRLLHALAALSGNLSLSSFEVTARGGRLDIRFSLTETLAEAAHEP